MSLVSTIRRLDGEIMEVACVVGQDVARAGWTVPYVLNKYPWRPLPRWRAKDCPTGVGAASLAKGNIYLTHDSWDGWMDGWMLIYQQQQMQDACPWVVVVVVACMVVVQVSVAGWPPCLS